MTLYKIESCICFFFETLTLLIVYFKIVFITLRSDKRTYINS